MYYGPLYSSVGVTRWNALEHRLVSKEHTRLRLLLQNNIPD